MLTLWGLDFRREFKRIDVIARKSHELGKDIAHIDSNDIIDSLHLFEVYTFLPSAKGYHIAVIINWIFCILGIGLLLSQINLLLKTVL